MYKLIEINEFIITRCVKLENCDTKNIDNCFDDSDLKSEEQIDFSFMNIGHLYKCKILLFGVITTEPEENSENSILCTHSNKCVQIGKYHYLEIESQTGRYYIEKEFLIELNGKREFWFKWSRKDLIQVNEVVNPRCLR